MPAPSTVNNMPGSVGLDGDPPMFALFVRSNDWITWTEVAAPAPCNDARRPSLILQNRYAPGCNRRNASSRRLRFPYVPGAKLLAAPGTMSRSGPVHVGLTVGYVGQPVRF